MVLMFCFFMVFYLAFFAFVELRIFLDLSVWQNEVLNLSSFFVGDATSRAPERWYVLCTRGHDQLLQICHLPGSHSHLRQQTLCSHHTLWESGSVQCHTIRTSFANVRISGLPIVFYAHLSSFRPCRRHSKAVCITAFRSHRHCALAR